MLNMIKWTDDYIIGIDEIDKQHQYLFELVSETIKCSEVATLQLALVKLYQYTREHFSDEESLMKRIDYPEYDAHQLAHTKLLEELTKKSDAVLHQHMAIEELNEFLLNWLSDHILKVDVEIGAYINQN